MRKLAEKKGVQPLGHAAGDGVPAFQQTVDRQGWELRRGGHDGVRRLVGSVEAVETLEALHEFVEIGIAERMALEQ